MFAIQKTKGAWLARAAVGLALLGAVGLAAAQAVPGGGGIPTVPLPAEAGGGSNVVQLLRWGFGVIVLLLCVGMAGMAVPTVGFTTIGKFKDYTSGRGELGDFVGATVVGIVVLAVVFALAALGLTIIPVTLV
jgi:Protein of unknown function (DUF2976)